MRSLRSRFPLAIALVLAIALGATLAGCVSLEIGGPGSALVRVDGPATAYLAVEIPEPSEEPPVQIGVLQGTRRKGEIVSIDVWPLFGVGIGAIGGRASVLGIEVGVGSLFYRPEPLEDEEPAEGPEAPPSEGPTSEREAEPESSAEPDPFTAPSR